MLDYGLEGYGLYWYCIELIAGKVDADNITFSLEHDARIIARATGSTAQKVEEMMRYFVKVGLFENSDGVITCLKMAKRLDQSMTSNKAMRAIIDQIKAKTSNEPPKLPDEHEGSHDFIKVNHDEVMQEEIRLEEIRKEKTLMPPEVGDTVKREDKCPHQEIISAWHRILPELPSVRTWSDQRKKALSARWKQRDLEGNQFAGSIEYWVGLFGYIRKCPWLMGENQSKWTATLPWIIEQRNFNKVIEGAYERND